MTEIPEKKATDAVKNKKMKTVNSDVEKSKPKEEEKNDQDDFQNSYVLMMSQSKCDSSKTEDSECTFEPFTQVSCNNGVFLVVLF